MRIIILRLFTCIALLCASLSSAMAVEKTTPDVIQKAARQFLDRFTEDARAKGQTVTYTLGTLDSRIRLAPCPSGPDISFSSDPMRSTQPTLEVQCNDKRPWRLFLSATVSIQGDGLIAARTLTRGARVTADMIEAKPIVLNDVRRGPITDPQTLIGMEVRRSVNAGTVFTADIVTEPDAVTRGDHVIIVARSGPVEVESRGKALANAHVGEQVMVENLHSSRTLRATVTGPGRVEVLM
ncbi:MAG: flagella basal body P-ring formation protein FlgA [Alteromonadaceae bacterium]|nr:flagella basal body P-ring formation protein FlgA [Alteromonadaceae bacterium]MBH85747.1 flagella basal body P-ring formation protein FlgA [Alteromonadaceae bacterium]|tara:strand:+ start:757 stop:1473 length:717 start_codon:yes stop_codon:yes gene_type:complete